VETRATVSYALTTTVRRSFADTLDATRASLAEQGFGVLTEIDLQATLKAKLDVAIPAQVILAPADHRWHTPLCRLNLRWGCCCRATSSSGP